MAHLFETIYFPYYVGTRLYSLTLKPRHPSLRRDRFIMSEGQLTEWPPDTIMHLNFLSGTFMVWLRFANKLAVATINRALRLFLAVATINWAIRLFLAVATINWMYVFCSMIGPVVCPIEKVHSHKRPRRSVSDLKS